MNTTDNKAHSHNHNHAPETTGRLIRWASHYDLVVRLMLLGRDKALRRRTVQLAQVKRGDSVLEVGCGTGELTIAAKDQAGAEGTVYGIDAAPEMIGVARSKVASAGIDIEYRVGLIERLTFADDSFDVVLSSLMMHHLPDDVKREGLAEILRVLKPSGHLLVLDMKRPTTLLSRIVAVLLHHSGVHTGVQDLPDMLKEAGFTRIEAGSTRFPLLGFVRGEAGK